MMTSQRYARLLVARQWGQHPLFNFVSTKYGTRTVRDYLEIVAKADLDGDEVMSEFWRAELKKRVPQFDAGF